MRSSDHFYSDLSGLAKRNRGDKQAIEAAARRAFVAACAPSVGDTCAQAFFEHWLGRYDGLGDSDTALARLGDIASFVTGDWDEETMELDGEDWASFNDILSAEAEDLDMEVLARLMTFLVERGALD